MPHKRVGQLSTPLQIILKKSRIAEANFSRGTMQCDTEQCGALELAAAVPSAAVIDFLLHFLLRTLVHDSQYFSLDLTTPKNCPFQVRYLDPMYYMVPWVYIRQHPKRHLDWFSRFCITHERNQQTDTDRQTDRPRYSVASNRLHLAIAFAV